MIRVRKIAHASYEVPDVEKLNRSPQSSAPKVSRSTPASP
jgi:hypothetical protein